MGQDDETDAIESVNNSPAYKNIDSPVVDEKISEEVIEESDDEITWSIFVLTKDGYNDPQERLGHIAVHVCIPLVIASAGMVAAGLLLDKLQYHDVFKKVPEMLMLVPVLLGLKANPSVASHLSKTDATKDDDDDGKRSRKMITRDLIMVQARAIDVGFLASVSASLIVCVVRRDFDVSNGFLLCVTGVITAATSSLLSVSVLTIIVLASRLMGINSESFAASIAGAVSDVTTVCVLAFIAGFLHRLTDDYKWFGPILIRLIFTVTLVWFYISGARGYTREVLHDGWAAVTISVMISSIAGFVFEMNVTTHGDSVVFAPVMNGIVANLVSIYSIRVSSGLKNLSNLGIDPKSLSKTPPNPIKVFCSNTKKSRAARLLICLGVVCQISSAYVILLGKTDETIYSYVFSVVYHVIGVCNIALLLYVADWLVRFLWTRKHRENAAVAYLRAMSDLIGVMSLSAIFHAITASRSARLNVE